MIIPITGFRFACVLLAIMGFLFTLGGLYIPVFLLLGIIFYIIAFCFLNSEFQWIRFKND